MKVTLKKIILINLILWSLISNDAFATYAPFIISYSGENEVEFAKMVKKILYKKFNIPSQVIVLIKGPCETYSNSVLSVCVDNNQMQIMNLNKKKLNVSYVHLIDMNNENEKGEK